MGDGQSAAPSEMRRIVWSDQAREDLIGIGQYIAGFSPRAARQVAAGLIDLSESLDEFSDRGRPVRPGVRELTTFQPYIIRYAIHETEVWIITLRHSARRRQL